MTLFAILICLLSQRYLNLSSQSICAPINHYFDTASSVFKKWGVKGDTPILLLLLVCIFVLIGGVNLLLTNVWFNSLKLIFQVCILFYCVDGRDLTLQLKDHLKSDENNQKEAEKETSGTIYQIFLRSQRYIFSVLFWYILLGPAGAAVYAVTRILSQHGNSPDMVTAAEKILTMLDWVPVRITGLTYALVGHFNKAFTHWRKHLGVGIQSSKKFEIITGLAALELDESDIASISQKENQKALDLIQRAAILWIVLIALFTLVAWIA